MKRLAVSARELLAVLEHHPGRTVNQLVDLTDGAPNQVGGLLGQLKQQGRVTRARAHGVTRWDVVQLGPEVRPQPPDPLEGHEGTARMMRANRSPL